MGPGVCRELGMASLERVKASAAEIIVAYYGPDTTLGTGAMLASE